MQTFQDEADVISFAKKSANDHGGSFAIYRRQATTAPLRWVRYEFIAVPTWTAVTLGTEWKYVSTVSPERIPE